MTTPRPVAVTLVRELDLHDPETVLRSHDASFAAAETRQSL